MIQDSSIDYPLQGSHCSATCTGTMVYHHTVLAHRLCFAAGMSYTKQQARTAKIAQQTDSYHCPRINLALATSTAQMPMRTCFPAEPTVSAACGFPTAEEAVSSFCSVMDSI